MLMNKILRYSFVALLAMVVGNVMATDVTDELTLTTFGVTGTTYKDVTGKKATSAAVYAANIAGGNSAIQLRSKNNNSGIVSTTSGGRIKSVKIEWNTNTNAERILDIYGSTTAYEAPADLYDTSKQGTKIASFTCSDGTKTTIIEGNYQYIGICSNKDAMYIDKITIVWESSSTAENANLSFSDENVKARLGKPFTAPTLTNEKNAPVVYSSSETTVAEVNAETGAVTLKAAGTTIITAAVPEGNASFYGQATYTLTVEELATVNTFPFSETFANTFGKFLVEDKSLAEGLSYVWTKNSGYVKASGFANSAAHASESWLVSPLFDLTNASAPNMLFEHAVNYFTDLAAAKQEATVWVREGDEGEWTKLEIEYPEELSWTFVSSGSIDLSAYVGKTIQIGFKYTSDAKAGTWEIKNFKVIDGQDAGLAFSKDKVSIVLGTENPDYPTLTNPHNVTVAYSSSDTNVAEIDAETGAITLKADGKTTIKATFAGNDDYLAGEVSYELTVIDESVKGRKGNPYTIAEVKALEETAYPTDKVWVIGYIAGCAADGGVISTKDAVNSNILLTATGEFDATDVLVPVALPSSGSIRTALNLVDHADYVGKEVKVYGTIESYFKVTGVKSVSDYELTGNSVEIKIKQYTITITPAEHGSMTLDKYEAVAGEKVYVTDMKVDDGYEMNEPTITAESGAAVEIGGNDEKGHYLIMPASNVTIALNISKLYTITTVFNSEQGDVRGISFDSEKSPILKGAGKNVKFTVTAKQGFKVESVTAACEDNTPITVNVAADNSYYEFQMPAKNVTITATFSPVSGISNITAAKAENAVRYNVAGQVVDKGYKGLVIVNGKKMLQK